MDKEWKEITFYLKYTLSEMCHLNKLSLLQTAIEAVRINENLSDEVIVGQSYEWWNGGIYEELKEEHDKQWEEHFKGPDLFKKQVQRLKLPYFFVPHLLVSLTVRFATWNSFLSTITGLTRSGLRYFFL